MCSNSHLCLRIYQFIQPGLFIFNPNLGFKINFSNTCTGYWVYCIVLSTKFLSLSPTVHLCASATPTLSARGRSFFIFFFFILWVELWQCGMLYNFVLRIEEGIFINRIMNWILSHVWKKKKKIVNGMSIKNDLLWNLFNKNLV